VALRKCENMFNGIRIAGCIDVVGSDSVPHVFWWRCIGNCPFSFAHRLD
jgi:hypothetical protein